MTAPLLHFLCQRPNRPLVVSQQCLWIYFQPPTHLAHISSSLWTLQAAYLLTDFRPFWSPVSFNGGLFLSSSPLEVCAPSSLMTAAANIAIDILSSLRMRCHMAFFARGRKWTQWCSGWLRLGLWWIYLFIWMKNFVRKQGKPFLEVYVCVC